MSSLRDEDVRGLDVAMHDARGASGIECVGDLDAEQQNLVDLDRLAGLSG
jgi:hypothetical protein